MPAQQGSRRDDQPQLPELTARQQPGKRGQHRSIRPRQPGSADLPLEHGHLVAQDQDLDVLGAFRPSEQDKPAEHPQYRQVGESQGHEYRQCPTEKPARSHMPNLTVPRPAQDTRSTATTGLSAPTGRPATGRAVCRQPVRATVMVNQKVHSHQSHTRRRTRVRRKCHQE
jgi:hypothetical protein